MTWILRFGGVLLLCFTAACSQEAAQTMNEAFPEQYGFLFQEMDDEARLNKLPYERISFEHMGSWWAHGLQITFCRDGGAVMKSEGTMKGHVHLYEYGRLCFLIDHLGFPSMESKYEWDGYEGGTIYVRVWPTGSSEPIVVEEYGRAGPYELWLIQTAIQGVAQEVRWKKEGT